ncbi:MAG: polyribonucleotide nucleotidyltransferase [Planctomycetota bacterium]|jgi:polyribonucleotide nucleotidyltransferase
MTRENHASVEFELDGKKITIETGHIARQAAGAVLVSCGDTQSFAAVVCGPGRDDIDFFPLTVDYREKPDAAGKIPGGFFKREGRPTTKEILTMRLIDRSIRPLFPDGFRQEVQVMTRVFGYDGETPGDVLAMIGAFAALHISAIPFQGALGAVRIGHMDGKFVALPGDIEKRGNTRLDLVVAGHQDALCMVEASADEMPEAEMIDALEIAHGHVRTICGALDELRAKVGLEKSEFTPAAKDEASASAVEPFTERISEAMRTAGKLARDSAVSAVKKAIIEELTGSIQDSGERKTAAKAIKEALYQLTGTIEREMILSGTRIDGRATDDIRQIWVEPNFINRMHGSVLFTRGETQGLVSTTLGTSDDEMIIDGIEEEYKKRFYLHYNFPSYSVGETRRMMGPGRREIGHGMLAERALAAIVPDKERFPYTIRIVSEITESNGSSSMASVCGGCLSMMLAGVPITQPVAGIAMGLVQEGDRIAILSDILGSEDHNGDMDFKVAGSGLGITALQMDIKIKGVTRDLLERAMNQARDGRIHILRCMLETVSRPSGEISRFAPRMESIKIPQERIGFLIGPGGRNIKGLQEQYKVRIAILNDLGDVTVSGTDPDKVEACIAAIHGMTAMPEIGTRYTGTIKSVKDFGAFIEILPGVEGMCHISELAEGYVDKVSDVVSQGDEIEVVVINVDDRGKIKLSHKQAIVNAD